MFLMSMLAACTSPSARVHALATLGGFQRAEIPGTDFIHVTYRPVATRTATPVHIYIEHDGLPWATATRMSSDPTPRDPLVLRLALQDPASVIYLGRPCYFGMAQSPPCTPLVWTRQRYSEQVVNSMVAALRTLLGESRPELVFFGHSGGGTLAWLMARHFPDTRAVVTVAANLDLRAWTTQHGFTPVPDSLSPADGPELPPQILQIHYAGSHDTVVPSTLIHNFARRRSGAVFIEVPGFDHVCCWERIWPAVLNDIDLRITKPETGSPCNAEKPIEYHQ